MDCPAWRMSTPWWSKASFKLTMTILHYIGYRLLARTWLYASLTPEIGLITVYVMHATVSLLFATWRMIHHSYSWLTWRWQRTYPFRSIWFGTRTLHSLTLVVTKTVTSAATIKKKSRIQNWRRKASIATTLSKSKLVVSPSTLFCKLITFVNSKMPQS